MLFSALLHLSYSDICVLPDTTRVECGFPGITVDECNARGCCFANPGGDHQCSKSPQPCVSRAATCSNHGACVAANATTKRPAQCACDAGYSGSRCDHRAPTPAQTNWHLFPKRLARHEDPAVRRLFSHWSVCMGEWAATDWSDDYRATMPNAV